MFSFPLMAQVAPPEPPPLKKEPKPTPFAKPSPTPIDPSAPLTLEQRYQNCFDKLLDKPNPDQKFMRGCLGLVPNRSKSGRYDYLTRAEIADGDKERIEDIKSCYDKVLRATRTLPVYPKGYIDVFVRIDGQGKVRQFRIGKRGMSDSNLLLCVNKLKDKWRYPKSTTKKIIPIRYRFNLAADISRKPKVEIADGFPKIKKPPGLTPAEIVPVVKSGEHLVQDCYTKALERNPKAQGKVIVEMVVEKRGTVRQAKIVMNEIRDPSLDECLTRELGRLKFPPPRGQKPFPIRYPFLLTTLP